MIAGAISQQPVPFLRATEEQVAKIKRQLEWSFHELWLVQDLIKISGGARKSVSSDLDSEAAHVLRRCGSERLFTVMKTFTEIVERFRGTTAMSEREDVQ